MVLVQITKNFQDIHASQRKLERLVKTICRRFNVADAAIGIAVVDHAQMRKLNAQFLNRSGSTDCLSFDLSESEDPKSARSFEVIVNGELAVEEARLRGHSSEAELALYVAHGVLHHLGFDDSTKDHAKQMHDIEDEILQELGYGLVYNKRRGQKCRSSKI
jgi:probable rRNA maturation factor